MWRAWWRGGNYGVGLATDRSQVRVPTAPLHVTTLGKLFTHNMSLFTKQYKLIPAIGWDSAVGLASHWPCVTDSVVYPPTGSMAWEREMSTSPKLHSKYYGTELVMGWVGLGRVGWRLDCVIFLTS